jgi:hypothetical protein
LKTVFLRWAGPNLAWGFLTTINNALSEGKREKENQKDVVTAGGSNI